MTSLTTGELLYPGSTSKATARERSSTGAGINGNMIVFILSLEE